MPAVPLIEESAANPEVRAVFDDIKATRNTDWINNFWKALANDPATLRRTWESQGGHGARRARPPDKGVDLSRGQRDQFLRILHGLARRRGEAAGHEQTDVRRAYRG